MEESIGEYMTTLSEKRIEEYIRELLKTVQNPNHIRLIEAYTHPNPVEKMEKVLGDILMEVLQTNED